MIKLPVEQSRASGDALDNSDTDYNYLSNENQLHSRSELSADLRTIFA